MGLVKCPECGKEISDKANSCPSCGCPIDQKKAAPSQKEVPQLQDGSRKVKKGGGCLSKIIAFFIVMAVIGAVIVLIQGPNKDKESNRDDSKAKSQEGDKVQEEANTEEETKRNALELDAIIWDALVNSVKAHNELMEVMQKYGEGSVDTLDLYNTCEKIEEYQYNQWAYFEGVKDDEVKKYKDACSDFALSSQIVAQNLKKYLDSKKVSDLSATEEKIESCTNNIAAIGYERTTYLENAGVSQEEIDELIEKIDEQLK